MKKSLVLLGTISLALLIAGCSNSSNSTNSHSETNSQSTKYKYYASGNVFYGPNGTIKINKVIPFKDTTRNNENSIMLDVTYKNASKKAMNIGDLFNINIITHQMNMESSQNVRLSDSQDVSGVFNDEQTDEQNKIINIINQQSNELQPGKEMHTLIEFGYKLDNNTNDVVLSLLDPLAISDSEQTVNPKKNKITIKMDNVNSNTLNLDEY